MANAEEQLTLPMPFAPTHLAFHDSKHNQYDDTKLKLVMRVLRLHPEVSVHFSLLLDLVDLPSPSN